MTEKRTKPRVEVCLDVRWQGSSTPAGLPRWGPRAGTHYNLRMADLSEGGCYVDTILEVTKGETLFLKILTPDAEWFEVQGVVAHHFPRLGFGVCFENLDEEKRRQISSLIHQTNPILEKLPDAWHLENIDVSYCGVM